MRRRVDYRREYAIFERCDTLQAWRAWLDERLAADGFRFTTSRAVLMLHKFTLSFVRRVPPIWRIISRRVGERCSRAFHQQCL